LQHLVDEQLRRPAAAVPAELEIVVHLQRDEEEAVPAESGQVLRRDPIGDGVHGLAIGRARPVADLADDRTVAVMLVARVERPAEPKGHEVADGRRRHAHELRAELGRWRDVRRDVVLLGIARQGRVGVVAVALEGHVVRAQVAFLEAPDRDAEGLGDPPRDAVDRPLVAEQDDRVRPLVTEDALERAFPGGQAVAVVGTVVADREQGVAAVKLTLTT
jgi:hypothetical protein